MLSRMHPMQFEELYRDHAERPWGDEWLIMSVMAVAVINELRRYMIVKPKPEDFLEYDHFVPKPESDQDRPAGDFQTAFRAMRAQIGV